jgi:hypothetical protein
MIVLHVQYVCQAVAHAAHLEWVWQRVSQLLAVAGQL